MLSEFLFLGLLLLPIVALAATQVTSTRVWPAQDYTRITLESAAPIQQYQMLEIKNPDRLVLDLENITVTPALNELAGKIGANDPYVKALRVGRFKPGVVRLVFDLKAEIRHEVFTLRPIAEYGYRLPMKLPRLPKACGRPRPRPYPNPAAARSSQTING